MHRTSTEFYVYGLSPDEIREPDWLGKAEGFAVLSPAGHFIADGMKIALSKGHEFIALKLRDTAYWLVASYDPEYRDIGLQRFVRNKNTLLYLSEASTMDWQEIQNAFDGYTMPWTCQARLMEFALTQPKQFLFCSNRPAVLQAA